MHFQERVLKSFRTLVLGLFCLTGVLIVYTCGWKVDQSHHLTSRFCILKTVQKKRSLLCFFCVDVLLSQVLCCVHINVCLILCCL